MAIQKKRLIMDPSLPPVTLPDDIIFSILMRFPVKSFIRFSCVCKNWHSIIKNQGSFMLRFRPQRRRYLLSHFPLESPKPEKLWSFTKLSDSPFVDLPHLEAHFNYVFDSCNGLFCIHYETSYKLELCLWNPTIRRYKILPSGSLLSSQSVLKISHNFVEFTTISLGFDSNSNDYKIIVIKCAYDTLNLTQLRTREAEIYSLTLDSWRKLEIVGLDHLVRVCDRCAFIDGAFHWLADCISEGGVRYSSILRYNMFEERFEEIELPKGYRNYALSGQEIAVFRGLLAVLFHKHGEQTCYLWTMNGGFWSKLEVKLPEASGRMAYCLCRCVGDFVVTIDTGNSRVCLFDPLTLQTKVVQIPRPFSVHAYSESLALL